MKDSCSHDILNRIEQPSRYLGSEKNAIRKPPGTVKLRMALVFPDLYEIGMSHFGIHILYHILNARPDIAAERVFAPATDMEARLRAAAAPLVSLESRMPLKEFDIVGFSLLYELNYTNILNILDLSNIPFRAAEREGSFPFIIAGGPCTSNPEPVAEFFDAMVIGDGEQAITAMAQAWMQWQEAGGSDKQRLLDVWSTIEGVYIPAFFTVRHDAKGIQETKPNYDHYQRVRRAIIPDLNQAPFPDTPIVPYGRTIHDRLRLELARGCDRGCRFCQAGTIYRPVRERSLDRLITLADVSLKTTGMEEISLLSLSTGDYEPIGPLVANLIRNYQKEHVAVSLPSFRAGTLSPELMEMIRRVRKTGFTIAPEAGGQRLRDVINKNLTEGDILKTVSDAFRLGWQVIKLYFMIGLPTETDQDVKEIVHLVKRLRRDAKGPGRGGKLHVSVATFVPKPHTPFQWEAQLTLAEAREKLAWLRDHLKIAGVQMKWQNPQVSWLEGLWARGDRRLASLLERAFRSGCRFDGWSDQFQYQKWVEAVTAENLDVAFIANRCRGFDETLPWDHVDIRVSKVFLVEECRKAKAGHLTEPCRSHACNTCGVCDFDTIMPVRATMEKLPEVGAGNPGDALEEGNERNLILAFQKLNPARFFGHLEMVKIFERAFKRSGLVIKYTHGFHPKPKISFLDALPVGMESRCEEMTVTLLGEESVGDIMARLNAQLPDGLTVTSGREQDFSRQSRLPQAYTYQVEIQANHDADQCLGAFNSAPEVMLREKNRKGNLVATDLKQAVLKLERVSPGVLQMTLGNQSGKTPRPHKVLEAVFGITPQQARECRVIKIGFDRTTRTGSGIT